MATKASKSEARQKAKSPTSSSSTMMSGGAKGSAKVKIKDNGDGEKSGHLAYKVLSLEHTQDLMNLATVEEVQEKLSKLMELQNCDTDLKDAALSDYYTSGFWWGKEKGYSVQQLSGFFTVLHTLMENIKEKHLTMAENLFEFKKMFAGIGQDNPEVSGGLDFFDVEKSKEVADYVNVSLFQHYKLYDYMFTTTQAEEIIGTDLDLEVAKPPDMPWPPPLEEGIPEDIFVKYIKVKTPEATPEPGRGTEEGEGESRSAAAEGSDGESSEERRKKEKADEKHVKDLLSQLSAEEVSSIVNKVAGELLGGLKSEVSMKLQEKENSFINRINKIHRIA